MKLKPEYDHGLDIFENGKTYKGKLNFVDIFASDTEHEFFHKFICDKLNSPIDIEVTYHEYNDHIELEVPMLNTNFVVPKNFDFYPDASVVTSDYIRIALDEMEEFEGWQVFAANIEVHAHD